MAIVHIRKAKPAPPDTVVLEMTRVEAEYLLYWIDKFGLGPSFDGPVTTALRNALHPNPFTVSFSAEF